MDNNSDDDLLKTGGGLGVFADIAGDGDEAIVGRQLGDYRITGLIAEGGMGRVFRASRTDGSFEREVAIKISPVSGFSDSMRQRFAQEQGVLAGLNHPNIAQLYDAQVTEEGWPYIVMELVDGGAITTACEDLSIGNRVGLLIDIVDAIAFAHARLIVHRDIKPSNILVSEDGRPKLLDFGIAKLLEGDERDLTRASPMTPRYASPEQLLGQPITTASDIYQLGVLIWEVLTGEVLNQDPELSTAIQRAAAQKPVEIAGDTKRSLPGELVLIVEQCLRVSPEERYRDASSLKRDLQAYLDGYPVSAAGQSAGYRFKKFIGRNIPATAIASIATVAIVGGGTWYTWQLADARDLAEQRADTSTRLLQTMSRLVADTFSGLLDQSAERNVGNESYVESTLNETLALIDNELGQEPDARAQLLNVQGTIELALGNYQQSADVLDEALSLLDADRSPETTVRVLLDRTEVASRLMDFDTARTRLEQAAALVERHDFGGDVVAHYWHQRGQASQVEGNYEQSVQEFERAVDILQQQDPLDTRLLASTYEEIAFTYTNWERFPEALAAAESAIDILERTESSVSHRLIHPLRFAGFANLRTDQTEAAKAFYERALSIASANFGGLHPDVAAVQDSLGSLAYKEGRFRDAVGHFEEEIRIVSALEGPDATGLLVPKINVAVMYTDLGEMERAGRYFAEALVATESGEDELKHYRFVAIVNEVRRRTAIGDYQRAVELNRERMALANDLMGPDSFQAVEAQVSLGRSLARAGHPDEARKQFDSSFSRYGEIWGAGEEGHVVFSSNDWILYWLTGDLGTARSKLTRYLADKVKPGDADFIYWTEAFGDLATICMALGELDCAKEALETGKRRAATVPSHPWSYHVQVVEAEYLVLRGDNSAAKAIAEGVLPVLLEKYPARTDDIRRARAIIDS